jgi:hypothetical protein
LKALKAELCAPPVGAQPSKDPRKAEANFSDKPPASETTAPPANPDPAALKGEDKE